MKIRNPRSPREYSSLFPHTENCKTSFAASYSEYSLLYSGPHSQGADQANECGLGSVCDGPEPGGEHVLWLFRILSGQDESGDSVAGSQLVPSKMESIY